jgi:hypothetical protein
MTDIKKGMILEAKSKIGAIRIKILEIYHAINEEYTTEYDVEVTHRKCRNQWIPETNNEFRIEEGWLNQRTIQEV